MLFWIDDEGTSKEKDLKLQHFIHESYGWTFRAVKIILKNMKFRFGKYADIAFFPVIFYLLMLGEL